MSRAASEFATARVLAVSQLIPFRWSMLTLLWCVVFTSVSHFWGCGLLSGGKCFHFTQMSHWLFFNGRQNWLFLQKKINLFVIPGQCADDNHWRETTDGTKF